MIGQSKERSLLEMNSLSLCHEERFMMLKHFCCKLNPDLPGLPSVPKMVILALLPILYSHTFTVLFISWGDYCEAPYTDHTAKVGAKICQVIPTWQRCHFTSHPPEMESCHFHIRFQICRFVALTPSHQKFEKMSFSVRTSDFQSAILPLPSCLKLKSGHFQ